MALREVPLPAFYCTAGQKQEDAANLGAETARLKNVAGSIKFD